MKTQETTTTKSHKEDNREGIESGQSETFAKGLAVGEEDQARKNCEHEGRPAGRKDILLKLLQSETPPARGTRNSSRTRQGERVAEPQH